jgi:hypothetical protein
LKNKYYPFTYNGIEEIERIEGIDEFTFGELASLGSRFQSFNVSAFKGSRVQRFKGFTQHFDF